MATSGTVGQTVIDIATILEHAIRRCRIPAALQTPELTKATLENLHFSLNELATVGLNLWCIEKVIQGIYKYQEAYPTLPGTVDILDTFLRNSSRAGGILSSSDGSNVSPLEDGDILTSTTQTVTGGNFLYTFTQPTAVRTVGILHKGAATRSLVLEFSQDNVTWATIRAVGTVTYADEIWYWYDMDPSRAGLYFRVRDTLANSPLAAYELYISADINTEITMARMNRDDFTNLPNKFNVNQGSRPLQFWLDRGAPVPIIRVWPSPGDIFDQIIYWRHRHIQDVGTDLTLTLDIPPRWLECIVCSTALKTAYESDDVDPAAMPMLKDALDLAMKYVESEEVDKSPMVLRPNLRHYTRGR